MTLPSSSLSMLLDGIIDYAGLYPPASLSMDDMVSSWARGLASEQAWLLGRVIVPVDRLDEFEGVGGQLFPRGDEEEPWVLSALISTAAGTSLEQQVERITRFNEQHASEGQGGALIDVVEAPGTGAGDIDAMLDQLPEEVFPFFELEVDEDIRGMLAVLVGSDAGAKIRTGGIRPDLYPTTEQLANFIIQCAKADVPFKATAGLHHPLWNRNQDIGVMQFGFLNVFLASLLASSGEESPDMISSILTRGELVGIDFVEEGVCIDGRMLGLDAIEDARIAFSLSFGSCSIDEPVEDLVELGLLPPTGGVAND